jgi:hypothetical protein
MLGIMTEATCAEGCWYAREYACKCSCAGRNHGALLQDGVEQPRRNCKIQGFRYVLGRVAVLDTVTLDQYQWSSRTARAMESRPYSIPANNMAGALVWVKQSTEKQIAEWPEMADARELPRYARRPYIVWVREDVAEAYDQWVAAGRPDDGWR